MTPEPTLIQEPIVLMSYRDKLLQLLDQFVTLVLEGLEGHILLRTSIQLQQKDQAS